jgi:hypothetical protein
MTIRRCAWHVREFGRPKTLGWALRPWTRFQISHGICAACRGRVIASVAARKGTQ